MQRTGSFSWPYGKLVHGSSPAKKANNHAAVACTCVITRGYTVCMYGFLSGHSWCQRDRWHRHLEEFNHIAGLAWTCRASRYGRFREVSHIIPRKPVRMASLPTWLYHIILVIYHQPTTGRCNINVGRREESKEFLHWWLDSVSREYPGDVGSCT